MNDDSKDAKRRETDSEPLPAAQEADSRTAGEAVEAGPVEMAEESGIGLVERIPEGESRGEIIGDVGNRPLARTRTDVEYQIRLETVTEMCRRVAEGESLRSIAQDPDMPSKGAFLRWCYEDAEFGQMYTIALRLRAAGQADEVVELADRAENCTEAHEVQAIKLMVNTRQWVASRLLPKQYGDHQIVEHTGEVKLDEAQVDARLRHLIRKLKGNEK